MTTRQNLKMNQGETFSYVYTHDVDLTGFSARMSIKTDYAGATEAYLSTGSDANGGTLTISGTEITIDMTAAQTENLAGELSLYALTKDSGPIEQIVRMIYDLELVAADGVTVTRALQGEVIIQREVTS